MPKIEAAFVDYGGYWVSLNRGVTVVGRNIDCRLRFNDSSVSRRHMRFVFLEDRLLAEDLGSTNGTRVNGDLLEDTRDLCDGDVIGIGNRSMRISLESIGEHFDDPTDSRGSDWISGEDRLRRPTPAGGTIAVRPLPPKFERPAERAVAELPRVEMPAERICPRCRAKIAFELDVCSACGYQRTSGLSMSVTQQINLRSLQGAERRKHPRVEVEIPVIYSSELLCFDGVARDLSRGGVFLATDLLDEVATECLLTLLPDGSQALAVHGVVRRVVQAQGGSQGQPPGMGIEFQKLNDDIRQILGDLVDRHQQQD